MFRQILTISFLSLFFFMISTAFLNAETELDKTMSSYFDVMEDLRKDTSKDAEEILKEKEAKKNRFITNANKFFNDDDVDLGFFLDDEENEDFWGYLNHIKGKNKEAYQTIINYLNTEELNKEESNPEKSGVAILVEKIQKAIQKEDSLEKLISQRDQCLEFCEKMKEKGLNVNLLSGIVDALVEKIPDENTLDKLDLQRKEWLQFSTKLAKYELNVNKLDDKIKQIESDMVAIVAEKLETMVSNKDVLIFRKEIKAKKVIYQLTGELFAKEYVRTLPEQASQLIDVWQSSKGDLEDLQDNVKSALTDKISKGMENEVTGYSTISTLLAYWNDLKDKDKEDLVQCSDVVLKRLNQIAPAELTGNDLEDILTKWNTLATSDEFNNPSAEKFQSPLLEVVNTNLTQQFPEDLKSLSSKGQIEYWNKLNNDKKLNLKTIASKETQNSFKEALKKQMISAFENEINDFSDCDECLSQWSEFQKNIAQIGNPSLDSTQQKLADKIRKCFTKEWNNIEAKSSDDYISYLEKAKIVKDSKLSNLAGLKDVIAGKFEEAWGKTLNSQTPETIVSLWESATKSPCFDLLPEKPMRALMGKQFGVCLVNKLSGKTDCQAFSNFWNSLKASMQKVGFMPSADMAERARKRFSDLLDNAVPSEENEILAMIQNLKKSIGDPIFQTVLDEKKQSTILTFWKKSLENLSCIDMLELNSKRKVEFSSYKPDFQKELKTAFNTAFWEQFKVELEANGKSCEDCISFWEKLSAHGFVPENGEGQMAIQTFTKNLDVKAPASSVISELESAEEYLKATLQSLNENSSIFKPAVNKKIAEVQQQIAYWQEFDEKLKEMVSNLKETPQGLEEFETNLRVFEEKFSKFATYDELHKNNQEYAEGIQAIFAWNRWCNRQPLSQAQENLNMRLIPEWQKISAESNLYDYSKPYIVLKDQLQKFFSSTQYPVWRQYRYDGLDYFILPKHETSRVFFIDDDDNTQVVIKDPSLIKDGYHHAVFNGLNQELGDITNEEIQHNPKVMYDFLYKALRKLRCDTNIHPAFAAYGICEILKIANQQLQADSQMFSALRIPQNIEVIQDIEHSLDFTKFKSGSLFTREERIGADHILRKYTLPANNISISTPKVAPSTYEWVGFRDSAGEKHIGKVTTEPGSYWVIEDGRLIPAETGSGARLLFWHSGK